MEKNLIDNQSEGQLDSSEYQMDSQKLSNNVLLNNKKNNDASGVVLTSTSTNQDCDNSSLTPGDLDNNHDNINKKNKMIVTTQERREYDPTIDERLPDTVTLLRTPDGGKVYLIGTAHFSEESQNDVSMIIQAVQPNIVMVELCEARVHILQLDEKTILKEAENLNLDTIRATIRQNGLFNGMLYVLLLNMSAHLTKQLGMAPGGEFRRAFSEATKIPKCLVHLGDRPINITLQRALSSLTWWQTIKLVWNLLRSKDPISKEDVERCKRRDLLEDLLAEMGYEFPCLGEVFVKERDLYLTHSLQLASHPIQCSRGFIPSRVVGIVGIGHMPGIIKLWGKVNPDEIIPIMKIPEKTMSSKIIKITVKVSLIGAVIYVGYKYIPLPIGSTLSSLKSSVEGLFKVAVSQ
ncbi:hypothetical protein HCN44_003539 [Aphidius gifuensis]|uniref:TraB domain-containing protein n=1 Tax=Aphidius gifuensis TaxID=684658 RepID=A0A834XMY9_APHGI|nr:traB domain-containing protein [Aphidius gifuensis]KAF7987676.1 hypothetical protein HCN44_003539 [Aphidius gifuensis]